MKRSIFRACLVLVGLTLVLALSTLLWLGITFLKELPDRQDLRLSKSRSSGLVYSGENEPLFNLRGPRYRWVPLGQIPNVVVRAFISIEDRDFFHHRGLSFKGIARAFWINLKAGEFLQGGSTITQQLVRMNFLDSQKSWERKAKEALLAVELEQRSSKEEILEYYLNTVFLGNHSYGIEAAARRYFNKPTVELNLSEASLLAGLPQAPSRYAPHRHFLRAKKRQSEVLKAMVDEGYLTEEGAEYARSSLVELAPVKWVSSKEPFYRDLLIQEMRKNFGTLSRMPDEFHLQTIYSGHLASHLRGQLEAAFGDLLADRLDLEHAFVALEPKTGGILAVNGSRDYKNSQFNRSFFMKRSLGGMVRPFYYSYGFKRGMGNLSNQGSSPSIWDLVVMDPQSQLKDFESLLGVVNIKKHMGLLGLPGFLGGQKSVATPLQYARSLSVLANEGRLCPLSLAQRMKSPDGSHEFTEPACRSKRSISPQNAYLASFASHLSEVANPRNLSLKPGIAFVAPSGRHVWMALWTGGLVAVAWVGSELGLAPMSDDPGSLHQRAQEFLSGVRRYRGPRADRFLAPLDAPPGLVFRQLHDLTTASGRIIPQALPSIRL